MHPQHLPPSAAQEGGEGAEQYQGPGALWRLERLLRNVRASQLIELGGQPEQVAVVLRVDRLSSEFGRTEDLEAGFAPGGASGRRDAQHAGGSSGRDAAAQQYMSAGARSPDGQGPPDLAHAAAQLRHLAPARLLGGMWGLITAEVKLSCMPQLPEDPMLGELEAMCRDMGTTGEVATIPLGWEEACDSPHCAALP